MNFKKLFSIIIIIQLIFTTNSYSQFTNPLDSIFNEIGKGVNEAVKSISDGVSEAAKSIGDGVQKSEDKSIDINNVNKNKDFKPQDNNKPISTADSEKKLDKGNKDYKPQCENPKMAKLLEQNSNEKKLLNKDSQVNKQISAFSQTRPPNLPTEITNEQWANVINGAKQKNISFISISKNSFTNKFYYNGGYNENQADEYSLLTCARSGRGEDCEVVFNFKILETNTSSTNLANQNKEFNQNFNQVYSKDPLLNKFFQSYNLYAQSTALLMEAYGKDQEAAIIRQSIADSQNPNKSENDKFQSASISVNKNNDLKDLIYCRTEPLSAESKKKYQEAIPYAIKAVITSVELKFLIAATAKNLKQASQSDPLAAGLTALVYASYTPKVVEYLSGVGSTMSFILTGAKANNIEGTPTLQSTLKDL